MMQLIGLRFKDRVIILYGLQLCCKITLCRAVLVLFVLDIRLTTSPEPRSQERSAPPGGASNYYCFHHVHVCHPGVVGVCGRRGPPAPETAVGQIAAYGLPANVFS